jgi:hypothetical protein
VRIAARFTAGSDFLLDRKTRAIKGSQQIRS